MDIINGEKNYLIETSLSVLTSVILAFIHMLNKKKDSIKQIFKIYHLYVVSTLIWRFSVKILNIL